MSTQPKYGAALAWAIAELSGNITEITTVVPLSFLATTQIVQGNGDRVGLILINNSSVDVLVGFVPGILSASAAGIILSGGGGTVSMTLRDDLTVMTRPWFVYCPNSPVSVLTAIEYVRVSLLPV